MLGKSSKQISHPNGGGLIHGDESHGRESAKKNTKQKQIQANNDHTPIKRRLINPTAWPTYNE